MTQEEGIRWHFKPPRARYSEGGGAQKFCEVYQTSNLSNGQARRDQATISEGGAAADLTVRSQQTPRWQTSRLRNSDPEDPRILTPNDFLNRPSTSRNPTGEARANRDSYCS